MVVKGASRLRKGTKMNNNKCACGSDKHSLAQSAACDGKRKYGKEYVAPQKKVRKPR